MASVGECFAGSKPAPSPLNTRNKDNDLRCGNWVEAEMALAYKSPVGAFGVHALYVQQYQDDSNNPWGPSRYRTFNVGPFFTTKIPGGGYLDDPAADPDQHVAKRQGGRLQPSPDPQGLLTIALAGLVLRRASSDVERADASIRCRVWPADFVLTQ